VFLAQWRTAWSTNTGTVGNGGEHPPMDPKKRCLSSLAGE